MSAESVIVALEKRYLQDFPREAARKLERLPVEQAAQAIGNQPVELVVPAFEQLPGDVQERLIERLPDATVGQIFSEMDPPLAAELLLALDAEERARWIAKMEPTAKKLVESLMAYAPDSAGRLMDPRVTSFRADMTAAEAIERMRSFRKNRALRELFLVDDDGVLSGRIEIQDLALSPPDQSLKQLSRPVTAAVLDTAPKEEVVEKIEQQRVPAIPVVGVNGRLVGVRGLVEKPDPADAPSCLAVIGRYILLPEVFKFLDLQQPGAGGEIQLTDAMARMIDRHPFHGLRFAGQRFDCGSRVGYLEAIVACASARDDLRAEMRTILERYR